MSDLEYKKLLAEVLGRVDERTTMTSQQVTTTPDSKEKVGVDFDQSRYKSSSGSPDVLNVGALISSLISGTELTDKDLAKGKPTDQDFKIFRDALSVDDYSGGGLTTIKKLKELFNTLFSPEILNDDGCVTIQQQSAKFLVRSSMSKILSEFNASSAGFVNERLLAGLMGGTTVPANTGTIADIIIGETGISLKLTKSASPSGSSSSLLQTLGITVVKVDDQGNPIQKDGNNKLYSNGMGGQVHKDGLFYILCTKKGDEISVTFFQVKYDDIRDILENHAGMTKDSRKRVFYGTDAQIKLFEDQVFLSSTISEKNKSRGISMYEQASFSIKQTIEGSNKEIQNLGEQMRETLEGLNNFLSTSKSAITAYCVNPTFENYQKMKQHFDESSKLQWEKLTTC